MPAIQQLIMETPPIGWRLELVGRVGIEPSQENYQAVGAAALKNSRLAPLPKRSKVSRGCCSEESGDALSSAYTAGQLKTPPIGWRLELVGRVGIEPTTGRLKAECSTAELTPHCACIVSC